MSVIRTPDQRLRVFISSTMGELAAERTAARGAVEALRLTPVLFELGARPHPPRELYQAYLDQSHIFIGIYWQSYGWVAPDMEISGLEDELTAAHEMPRLIYVKSPAPDREERLEALLDRLRDEAGISYKKFSSPEELKTLIEDDLALMLTERFAGAEADERSEEPALVHTGTIPVGLDEFVGREREIEEIGKLLEDHRLVTLSGPGGIGKTRLALEVAAAAADRYPDGAWFVPLVAVTQPELVIPTIAQALNVPGSIADPLEGLHEHLRERELLLVLDNFEQVVGAAPDVGAILEKSPGVSMLVTSREILNIRFEYDYLVPTLTVPATDATGDELSESEAVRLFLERARAVDFRFEVDADGLEAVAAICRRLDGLPLAIELAAARVRLLSPRWILDKLDDSLQLLKARSRDMPERHQTLRATIDWSFGLLDDAEKQLFTRLGVFVGGWTLEAAEELCPSGTIDVLNVMSALIEKSLVKQEDAAGMPRFTMLETVREYAADRLADSDQRASIEAAHAEHYLRLISAAYDGLRSAGQALWLEKLEADNGNLRKALQWAMDREEGDRVADAGWTIWLFWWINAHLAEARRMMNEVQKISSLSELGRAKAIAVEGCMAFWQTDYRAGLKLLNEAIALFRALDFRIGVAICQLPLGFVDATAGASDESRARYEESMRYFREANDEWGTILSINAYTWMCVGAGVDPGRAIFEEAVQRADALGTQVEHGMALRNFGSYLSRKGEIDVARATLAHALRTLWRGSFRGGATYTVEEIAEIAADEGAPELATRLIAAIDAVREATGGSVIPLLAGRIQDYVTKLRATLGDAAFEKLWAEGAELGMNEAVTEALTWAETDS